MSRTVHPLTKRELDEVAAANASTKPIVVFVHGLWLLPESWRMWRIMFEAAGYVTVAPGWPDDPETVAEALANPDKFAGKSVGTITDHFADVIRQLNRKPAIIGHSFGGLITQKLAGLGLAAVSVAIDPAPFRGVLPLPISALTAAFPVLSNPFNYSRAVLLTFAQFRYAFANAVEEAEAKALYEAHSVPGAGLPLFQAATANLNPWTEVAVDSLNPDRGPMKILSGQRDNTVPFAIANASYSRQKRNSSPTEFFEVPGRGHSLIVDSGWREVADIALEFVRTYLPPTAISS